MSSLITEIIARRELSYNDVIKVLNDRHSNKTEECSIWNKKYQSDFSKAKSIKDSFFGLNEDLKDIDLTSLFINSLSRMGLIDYFDKDLKFISFGIYKELESYLNEIEEFDLASCLDWCISNLNDHQQIQKCFQLFTYQVLITSTKSNEEMVSALYLLRKFIKKILKADFENLVKNFGLHSFLLKGSTQISLEELKLKAMSLFSSIYLNNQNLPIFDILQLR
jgi:hypothetical protein